MKTTRLDRPFEHSPEIAARPLIDPSARLLRVSGEQPCPYLPEQRERKLWLVVEAADYVRFAALNRAGFRRSGRILYRPACTDCDACQPTRLPVAAFSPSRSQKRVRKRNADLRLDLTAAKATHEHFDLFARYVAARHADGGMADMNAADFAQMVEDGPDSTRLAEWRDTDGLLHAACLVDHFDDGLSAVYSYFDPAAPERSLGTHVILDLTMWCQQRAITHLYLGYTIDQSPKMAYKNAYKPAERLSRGAWRQA